MKLPTVSVIKPQKPDELPGPGTTRTIGNEEEGEGLPPVSTTGKWLAKLTNPFILLWESILSFRVEFRLCAGLTLSVVALVLILMILQPPPEHISRRIQVQRPPLSSAGSPSARDSPLSNFILSSKDNETDAFVQSRGTTSGKEAPRSTEKQQSALRIPIPIILTAFMMMLFMWLTITAVIDILRETRMQWRERAVPLNGATRDESKALTLSPLYRMCRCPCYASRQERSMENLMEEAQQHRDAESHDFSAATAWVHNYSVCDG